MLAGLAPGAAHAQGVPVVTISLAPENIVEGQYATITVTAAPAPAADLQVWLRFVTSGHDHLHINNPHFHPVTVSAGSTTGTLDAVSVDDTAQTNDGNVTISIYTDPEIGYTAGSPSSVTLNIADNDAPATPPAVTISVAPEYIFEGETATITVTAAPASGADLGVNLRLVTSGHDYFGFGSPYFRTVTVPAGSTTGTFNADSVDDSAQAGDSNVTISILSETGYTVGSPSSVTLNIADNYVPNNAPTFAGAPLSFTLAENADGSTTAVAVGTVAATDADNDPLRYSITAGNGAGKFAIVSSTGAITYVGSGENYETTADPANAFMLTVRADDSNGGTADATVVVGVTDQTETPGDPGAPTLSSATTNSLTVQWTGSTNTGPAVTYDVEYRQGTSGSWSDGPQDETGTSATITSLMANTGYQVRVQADNGEGQSMWVQSASTLSTGALPAPGQVTSVQITEQVGQLRVTWNAATNASGYKVQWKSGTQSYNTTNRQAAVTATNHTISNLTAGTQYTVRVTATRQNAPDGTPSAERTGTPMAAAPGQVTNVQVTEQVGQLQVTWNAATNASGYKVQWKSGTQSYNTTNRQAAVTATSHTISNLTAGTQYTVRVTATRQNTADGTPSAERTGTPMAAAPGQVTNVQVTEQVEQLRVTWNAATNASGYKVQWKSGTQSYNTTNRQATVTATSHTISNLTAGTQYTVRVTATRQNTADGTPSAERTGTPMAAAPGQVTNVQVTEQVGAAPGDVEHGHGRLGLQGAVEVGRGELQPDGPPGDGDGDQPHDPEPDGGDAVHGAGDRDAPERGRRDAVGGADGDADGGGAWPGDRGDGDAGRGAARGAVVGGHERLGLQGAVEIRNAGLRRRNPSGDGDGDQPHDPEPDGWDAVHGARDRDAAERERRDALGRGDGDGGRSGAALDRVGRQLQRGRGQRRLGHGQRHRDADGRHVRQGGSADPGDHGLERAGGAHGCTQAEQRPDGGDLQAHRRRRQPPRRRQHHQPEL